jgi:hypothetical protein
MSIPPPHASGVAFVGGVEYAVHELRPGAHAPPRRVPSLAAALLGPRHSTGTPGLRGHFGTPPRARRGRPGVMRPSLRVSQIKGFRVGSPRHASSANAPKIPEWALDQLAGPRR